MLDREACERRVYRLATLLTCNPRLATGVITAVVDAQPDLRRLDSAHMDRLTVLRSREITPGLLPAGPRLPDALSAALAGLPAQHREAWVFTRVYKAPLRETARAMDCSVTATRRHLEMAERALISAIGPEMARDAPQRLLGYAMSLDVPPFHRARRRRRRIMRLALIVLMIALLIAAVTLFWIWI